jgi:hypothetical protein
LKVKVKLLHRQGFISVCAGIAAAATVFIIAARDTAVVTVLKLCN